MGGTDPRCCADPSVGADPMGSADSMGAGDPMRGGDFMGGGEKYMTMRIGRKKMNQEQNKNKIKMVKTNIVFRRIRC